MEHENIVIIGGGFSGIQSLKTLYKLRKSWLPKYKLILIDRKENFEFLPLLPDVLSGKIKATSISSPLKELSQKYKCQFIQENVHAVDKDKKTIQLDNRIIPYTYLIISTGAEPNFFDNNIAREQCYTLNNAASSTKLSDKLENHTYDNIIIVGGGYTGIEIATAIRSKKPHQNIYILEQSDNILNNVPKWISQKVKKELENLEIKVLTNDSLKSYDKTLMITNSGKKLDNSLCIWSTGMKAPNLADNLKYPMQYGRVQVESNLTPLNNNNNDNIFIAGDSGVFNLKNIPLRMGVNFSICEGRIAAKNIIRSIEDKPLLNYKPVDLGYIIPMAHGKAYGLIMGNKIKGLLGYCLHYFICIIKSEGVNKIAVIRDLICKRRS